MDVICMDNKQKTIVFKVSDNIKKELIDHYYDMRCDKISARQTRRISSIEQTFEITKYRREIGKRRQRH